MRNLRTLLFGLTALAGNLPAAHAQGLGQSGSFNIFVFGDNGQSNLEPERRGAPVNAALFDYRLSMPLPNNLSRILLNDGNPVPVTDLEKERVRQSGFGGYGGVSQARGQVYYNDMSSLPRRTLRGSVKGTGDGSSEIVRVGRLKANGADSGSASAESLRGGVDGLSWRGDSRFEDGTGTSGFRFNGGNARTASASGKDGAGGANGSDSGSPTVRRAPGLGTPGLPGTPGTPNALLPGGGFSSGGTGTSGGSGGFQLASNPTGGVNVNLPNGGSTGTENYGTSTSLDGGTLYSPSSGGGRKPGSSPWKGDGGSVSVLGDVVPERGSMLLLSVGMLGLLPLFLRRTKRA